MQLEAEYDLEAIEQAIIENRLFDARWYSRKYGLKFGSDADALQDFLATGAAEQRNPNALFDALWYCRQYLGGELWQPAFFHYLAHGAALSFWPHPLVDITYVAEQLIEKGQNDFPILALLHKCNALKLSPHPTFSTSHYHRLYPDLVSRRVHPVIHYIDSGMKEGRCPHPLLSPDAIRSHMNDASMKASWHLHYLADPRFFDLSPSAYFDSVYYLENNPDLRAAKVHLLYHYLRFGFKEGRSPNPRLDFAWASAEYKDQLTFLGVDLLTFVVTNQNGYVYANPQRLPLLQVGPKEGSTYATSPSRRRILYFSHNLKIQGAQTSLFEIAVGMKSRYGHQVEVLAPDDGAMKQRYEAESIVVNKFMLPARGHVAGNSYERLLSAVERIILDFAPDVVHANTIQTYHAVALAARNNIPVVWNIRESEEPRSHGTDFSEPAQHLLAEAIASKAHFAFVSATTARLWAASFPGIAYSVINNGIDYNRLCVPFRSSSRAAARGVWGVAPEEILLLSVGTWTERKGQRDIVDALGRIDKRLWKHLKVLMLGANESPYSAEVSAAIDDLPMALRARVEAVPETSGVADRARVLQAFAAADVFLFTSRIESYPRVVNEAMCFGLPIIATPCFGVVEQLQDGISARFYEAGDVARMAELIQHWTTDEASRKTFGREAKEAALTKVMQYDEMLGTYNKLYAHIV